MQTIWKLTLLHVYKLFKDKSKKCITCNLEIVNMVLNLQLIFTICQIIYRLSWIWRDSKISSTHLMQKKKKNSLKSANGEVKTKRKSKYKPTDCIQQEQK